jgi:hypothetical protein
MKAEDTQTFGKRQEFMAIAKLMARGCDVYLTLVDNQQIDCIVRHDRNDEPAYYDVQIKARSRAAQAASWGTWPNIRLDKPRERFFVVFYSEPLDQYWVIPSLKLKELASRTRTGRYEGHYTVSLAQFLDEGPPRYNPKFEEYRAAFHLLGAWPVDPDAEPK